MSCRDAAHSGTEGGLHIATEVALDSDGARDMGDMASGAGLPLSAGMLLAPSPRRSISSNLGPCDAYMSKDCAYVGLNI